MNKLSTTLVYADYSQLIKHYRKPEFWKQRWTIYDYGGIVAELAIVKINTLDNKIYLGVDIRYAGDKKHRYKPCTERGITSWSDDIVVPIDNPDYTQVHFQKAIYGAVKSKINWAEISIMYDSSVYKQEQLRLEELKQRLTKTAEDFLDDLDVTDEDFRDSYITAFVRKHADASSQFGDIYKMFCNVVLAKELYLWASFNKHEEDMEKYHKVLSKKKVSKSAIMVWLQKQKDTEFNWTTLLPQLTKGG